MKRFCSCGHEGIAVEIAKEQTLTNSSLVFRWLQLASYCVKSYQLVDWVAWITQLTQLAQMPYCIVNTVTHTHKHARTRVHTHTHTHTHDVVLNMETGAVLLTSMALWSRQ